MKKPKPNIDHIAHQVHVTGVGPHKNQKKYKRKVKHKNATNRSSRSTTNR
jgi:hypothetical protein